MKISQHIHRQLRVKKMLGTLILLTLIGSLAWLSARYTYRIDVTDNAVNSLSSVSLQVLESLTGPVHIKAYVKKDPSLRSQIAQLIDRYRRYKPDLTLTFIDPDSQPDKVRELEIPPTGAVFVEYNNDSRRIAFIDESTLTNTLLQLSGRGEHWITFLSGHGERAPDGHANFDLGRFGAELQRRNINVQTLNLAEIPAVPDNSELLVIAGPNVALLPGEASLISDYVRNGGNLLWLTDPGAPVFPELERLLGVVRLPGTILDDNIGLYGIDDSSFILISRYSGHPITQKFSTLTLYPIAAAFDKSAESDFKGEILLKTSTKSWTETGALDQSARFDADGEERDGPLALGYTLTRQLGESDEQRVVTIGDGDFLSNAYLDNVGNLELGIRMINWLIHDDRFVDIPVKSAADKNLALTPVAVAVIAFGYLIVLPILLLATGLIVWRKRKNR